MFNLQRAKKSPTIFRRLTDITPQAFEELVTVLKKAYPEFERERLSRREREREIGAGGIFVKPFFRGFLSWVWLLTCSKFVGIGCSLQ